MSGESIANAIRQCSSAPALIAYVTAGFPTRAGFLSQLDEVGGIADVIEIGVPFSDPMADGTTIQRSSRVALGQGVSLRWILEQLRGAKKPKAPLLLMSYLNPLLAYGLDKLPQDAARAGISGFIVPDLPYEECTQLRGALNREQVSLVQFVTPVTPAARMKMLCEVAQGFIYAVTMTGVTGKNVATSQQTLEYFDRVRTLSPVPVCAGFGIRSREQVAHLRGHVDGVIVGSALVEVLERNESAAHYLQGLRQA